MFAAYFPGEKYTITFEPTSEQSDAMTRMVAARSTSNAEWETMLQMLGIIPSKGAFNPTARDAWTKKPTRVPDKKPNVAVASDGSTECKNGHIRSQYSFLDPRGHVRCRKCHAVSTADSRKRKQTEMKEKAA
jgi:hypothetical protein